jgi:signal transduction histidine kinase/FixJ family two-component response regulator
MKTAENGSLLILVVDDEIDTRDGCERILSRMGYRVRTAGGGDEALEVVRTQPVSIVLLDLKMPGADGMNILEQIRELNASILVIVITGYATVELAIEAMKLGAYDFIPKPFEPDQLRIVVRRAHEKIRLTNEAIELDLERQRTLADLGNEKSRTRTIIESLPTGVVVTNTEGKVVLMNPTFLQQLDLEPTTEAGADIDAYVGDEHFCQLVLEISRGNQRGKDAVAACEVELRNGKSLLAKGRPIVGAGGHCLGAVMTLSDITALRALDRVKSEFVAEVSHELRSPLSTIHEQLALVIRDLTSGSTADDLPILSRAFDKTHDLIALVGDLLDLSRIESGTSYSMPQTVCLEEMLEKIVSFLATRAQKRGQKLTLELPAEPLPDLIVDPFALEGIFGNLVSNAINYTQDGGKIRVKAKRTKCAVQISVVDNGMGIDQKHLERIFERFYRVKNEKTRHISGTGLGLPIVKELTDKVGGTIRVKSVVGRGSTFTVVLPVGAEVQGEAAPTPVQVPSSSSRTSVGEA